MKRLAKYLGITAIVLVLLLCAGSWIVNRWLQSAAGHARMEEKIGAALRLPIKIGKLTFSVWSGITAKEIRVTGSDGVAFEAAGISASQRFSALLRASFALDELRIEQPRFVVVEDASGKWRFAIGAPSQPAIPAVAPQPSAAAPKPPRESSIGKIIIEGGTAEFIDKTHAPFAVFKGINATLREVTLRGFTGDFRVAQAILNGVLSINNITGIATRAGAEFQIRKLTAGAGGGSVTGEATWIEKATGSLILQCNHVDLSRASQDAGAAAKKISGMLDGNVQLVGLGGGTNTMTGNGALTLKNGNCAQFEVLRQIGDVLRVASLANFEIADATATFQIAGGQIVFAPVEVSAPPVGVTLNGPAAFDGLLNLTASLHAPAELVARQPVLAPQFSPPDAKNRRSVPFNITGTFSKPRQNLAEKITGTKDRKEQRIIAAGAILSTLMDRKKPQQPAAVQPAPAQP